MFTKVLFAAALVVAPAAVGGPAATAAPAATGDHCVLRVIGQRPDGELITAAPRCYATFERAMSAEGVAFWGDGASARAAASGTALATFTLGTHYDDANQNPAGGSTSTVGGACNGGWLNTSSAWNNRIGSTANGCPSIRHFDGANLTGASLATSAPGGNLGPLDNKTTSIQYG